MKCLFCSLDSPGFLYPAIGAALALQERGHEVAFVTDQARGDLLAELGLRRISRGPKDGRSFEVALWGETPWIAIQVKHIEYALDRFAADVLVGQALTHGPFIVAARRDLPVASMGLCTYLWPVDGEPSEADAADAPQRWDDIDGWKRWRCAGMINRHNELCRLFRIPTFEGGYRDSPLLGHLFLLRNVPELEPKMEQLPERVHLVGSCLWEPESHDPELDAWLAESRASGKPIVYVQHGRFFHLPSFWPALVQALAGLGCRVAASVDKMDSEIGRTPEDFFIRPHIPQGCVLAAADLVIASANTTAFLGALTAGVPGLLIPGGGEQPDVAALGRKAGVARTLALGEATPETIRTAIVEILRGDCFQEKAAMYKNAFSQIQSFEKVADLLAILATTCRPVLRNTTGTARSVA